MHYDATSGSRPKVASGLYQAKIGKIDPADGRNGPQLKVELLLGSVETLDGRMDTVRLVDYLPALFYGGDRPSRFWRLALATGLQPEDLQASGIDTDTDLVGEWVTVEVLTVPSNKNDGSMYCGIENYHPAKVRRRGAADIAPAPAVDFGDGPGPEQVDSWSARVEAASSMKGVLELLVALTGEQIEHKIHPVTTMLVHRGLEVAKDSSELKRAAQWVREHATTVPYPNEVADGWLAGAKAQDTPAEPKSEETIAIDAIIAAELAAVADVVA